MIPFSLLRHLPLPVLAWATMCGSELTAEVLRLSPGVPVVVDASEPLAVRKAAEDLCCDLEGVLQAPSPLLAKPPLNPGPAIIISSAATDSGLTGPESHAILRRGDQVRLVGTDTRGAG